MAFTQINLNGHGRSLALQAVGSDQEPPRDSRGESIMSAGNSKDGLLPRIKSHTIKKIIDRVTLLVVSFFAKVPGGVKWAGIVLGSIVVQVFAGILGHDAPYIGMIHGLNAFVLFSAAAYAARLARTANKATPATVAA